MALEPNASLSFTASELHLDQDFNHQQLCLFYRFMHQEVCVIHKVGLIAQLFNGYFF